MCVPRTPFMCYVDTKSETMAELLQELSVCFEVRQPDTFNFCFALMLHIFPCNIITLALDTNISPLSQTFSSSLQLSYACLCRGNISSFVCRFTVVVV